MWHIGEKPKMINLDIILDGEGCWPDLPAINEAGNMAMGGSLKIAALPGGMQSGKPSVMIRVDLPGGKVALVETSLLLFQSAARAFTAKYGDLTQE